MKLALEGILVKPTGREKHWGIGIPLLEIYTQGNSKTNALVMIKDAVEAAVDIKGFRVEVSLIEEHRVALTANNFTHLVAFMLKQQRTTKALSLREVSDKMGSSSPNAFARYEQGKSATSLEKLAELMGAVTNEKFLLLKTG